MRKNKNKKKRNYQTIINQRIIREHSTIEKRLDLNSLEVLERYVKQQKEEESNKKENNKETKV